MVAVNATPDADAASASAFDAQARAEAERTGSAFVLYRDGDGRERLFVFSPHAARASVGRAAPADLLIDWDEQVSRTHARFELAGDRWEIVDDGLSSNGTFVNEQRVERRQLQDGDALRFGTTIVTFRKPAPAPAQTVEPSRAPVPAVAPPTAMAAAAGQAEAPAPAAVALSSTQRRVLVALCRPYRERFATPAGDEQIAEELFLSLGEVRTHVRVLYAKLGVEQLAPEQMRVRLVERAFAVGLITERDL